ncbi:ras-like protein family, member C, partial [Ascoidea rubescens DSM 1968]
KKIVAVGEGNSGKTCLINRFLHNRYDPIDGPTVVHRYFHKEEIANKTYNFEIWDTGGQEDYERLRVLSYADVDLFLMCYSIKNINLIIDVFTIWFPEIKYHSPISNIVLVACKTDLR